MTLGERSAEWRPVPERFEPATMGDELVAAEHFARYAWAAPLAAGRRVLDAGCGTGYGTAMLARAGAAEAIGVDVSHLAVARAREAAAGDGVAFAVADLRALDHGDGRYDLVVCFEVIEHVEDRTRVLDELVRVLAPGGVLLLSSPNRDVYVPGNPHHVFEYRPEELRDELTVRFAHVALRRQHGWIASAVLDDEAFAARGGAQIPSLRAIKAAGVEPGAETYTVAAASREPLPDMPPAVALTGTVEVRRWLELYEGQQKILHESARQARRAGRLAAERDALEHELRSLLTERDDLRAALAARDAAALVRRPSAARGLARAVRRTLVRGR